MPAPHKYKGKRIILNSKPTVLLTSQKYNSFESSLFSYHKHKKKSKQNKYVNKKIKKEIIIEREKEKKKYI